MPDFVQLIFSFLLFICSIKCRTPGNWVCQICSNLRSWNDPPSPHTIFFFFFLKKSGLFLLNMLNELIYSEWIFSLHKKARIKEPLLDP
jgi:hypothetical protein